MDSKIVDLQSHLSINSDCLSASSVLLHCIWGHKSEELFHISPENSFHKHKEILGEVNTIDAMLENHLEIF